MKSFKQRLRIALSWVVIPVAAGTIMAPVNASTDESPLQSQSVLFDCPTKEFNPHATGPGAVVRAKTWVTSQVPYSKSACSHSTSNKGGHHKYGNYRTDCSGLVSQAWGLGRSFVTGELLEYGERITSLGKVHAGDAFVNSGHAVLVASDRDSDGNFQIIEMAKPGTNARIRTLYASEVSQYTALRDPKQP